MSLPRTRSGLFDIDQPPFASHASSLSSTHSSSPTSPTASDSELFKMEENKELSTMPLPIPTATGKTSSGSLVKSIGLRHRENSRNTQMIFPVASASSPSPSLPQQFLFTPVERHNFPESLSGYVKKSPDAEDFSLTQFISETRQHRANAIAWNPTLEASRSSGFGERQFARIAPGSPSLASSSASTSLPDRKKSAVCQNF